MKKILIVMYDVRESPYTSSYVKVFISEDALLRYAKKCRPDAKNIRIRRLDLGQYFVYNHNTPIFPHCVTLDNFVYE